MAAKVDSKITTMSLLLEGSTVFPSLLLMIHKKIWIPSGNSLLIMLGIWRVYLIRFIPTRHSLSLIENGAEQQDSSPNGIYSWRYHKYPLNIYLIIFSRFPFQQHFFIQPTTNFSGSTRFFFLFTYTQLQASQSVLETEQNLNPT